MTWTRLAALPLLAAALAGCRVDLGWDVDQGDPDDASVRIRLLPFFLVDRDTLDDPDSRRVFALHSTGRFFVESPKERWRASNGDLDVEPQGAVDFSNVHPTKNVLEFDARFAREGMTTLQVRRAFWGTILDERQLEVARATSATRLRRYAETVLTPDAPDLGDTLHVAEGGAVGVLVDWRDDLDRKLLGKHLLELDVADADEGIVKVVERARDGATEDTWGDWFNFVAVAPSDRPGVVSVAAGGDVVRTVSVQVHAVDELDDVVITPVDALVLGGTQDPTAVSARWLTASALHDDTPVLAAPLQWYQQGAWVGEGTFAEILADVSTPTENPIVVCVGTTHVTRPQRPLDTSTPEDSDVDSDVDTDPADTLVVDSDPVDSDEIHVDSDAGDTDGGLGPVGSGLHGPNGEPCARIVIAGRIRDVRSDRFVEPEERYNCFGCDGGPRGASAAAVLLVFALRRRRR